MNNSTIQLKVDETKLVTNLRHAFTLRSNVISELMQNARRAGATEICLSIDDQHIIVDDNGCGIDDFSDLLTVASSGWDAQTIADESPFGLGFLAALYACQSIQIESRGTLLRASTEDILNQQMITLSSSLVHVGTTITLLQHDYPLESLQEDIVKLAQGFPIKVFLNDSEIARPHAMDQLHGIETEIGFFHLQGIHDGKGFPVVKNTQVYLQGLPIRYNNEDTFHRRFNHNFLIDLGEVGLSQGVNIVHLDSKQFIARVPDRDVLIDSKAVEQQISSVARTVCLEHLIQEKQNLSPEDFVNRWWQLAHTYTRGQTNDVFKALFNDIELIPAHVLSTVTDYPYILKTDEDCQYMQPCEKGLLSKQSLQTDFQVFKLDALMDANYEESNAIAYLFAYRVDSVLVLPELDDIFHKDHWIYDCLEVIDKPNEQFIFSFNNILKTAPFKTGAWVDTIEVIFCESCDVQHQQSGKTVTIDKDAFVLPARAIAPNLV